MHRPFLEQITLFCWNTGHSEAPQSCWSTRESKEHQRSCRSTREVLQRAGRREGRSWLCRSPGKKPRGAEQPWWPCPGLRDAQRSGRVRWSLRPQRPLSRMAGLDVDDSGGPEGQGKSGLWARQSTPAR